MDNLSVVWPEPGRYVLAVSGGADSMVLLDIFAQARGERGYELVVAHFDHGIRQDSHLDAEFVSAAAARAGLPFEVHAATLGRASEATARASRHGWLETIRVAHGGDAIITAHHQDDLLETSLLNLARGSGRLGLAPMPPGGKIRRPLLACTRAALREYAANRYISWREDPTNADLTNPRNYLRHKLLPAASPKWRSSYLEYLEELSKLNTKITQNINATLNAARRGPENFEFSRDAISLLSPSERQELIVAAARALRPGIELSHRLITEIADFAATGHSGTYRPLRQSLVLEHKNRYIYVTTNASR